MTFFAFLWFDSPAHDFDDFSYFLFFSHKSAGVSPTTKHIDRIALLKLTELGSVLKIFLIFNLLVDKN